MIHLARAKTPTRNKPNQADRLLKAEPNQLNSRLALETKILKHLSDHKEKKTSEKKAV